MSDFAEEAVAVPPPERLDPILQRRDPLSHVLRDRLIAIGEILLCSSLLIQFAIMAILYLAGWPPNTSNEPLSLPFVLTLSLGEAVVTIVLMIALTQARGESVIALWLGRAPVTREIALGLALVPVVFGMVVVLLNGIRIFAPWLHNVETNPLEQLATGSATDAALFSLVAIFAGGVKEELQRAFLLRRFEHLGGDKVGVVVLSIAFGLGHALQGRDAVIVTGTLGAFWAVIYLRRRSSVAPIISHAGFNSLEILRLAFTGN